MEAVSGTGCQLLCHRLQSLSKKLPMFEAGSHRVNGVFPRTQFNPGKSCTSPLTSLIDAASLLNNSKPSSFNTRGTLIRAGGSPRRRGLNLDICGGRPLKLESIKFGCSKKGRQICSLPTSGDGSSAGASDSTLDQEDTDPVGGSGAGFPLESTLRSILNQIDWNKLIFNWRKDEPRWTVPWTGQTIFQVMVLWFAAFWVMGSWVIPIAAQIAGFSRHSLTFRGQALYSLITDVAEGTVGIWILKRCLARFFPLPDGWFPIKWEGKHWLVEACWGCLLFPFVNKLSQLNLYLIPLPSLTSSYAEQSMMSRDPVATLLYAIVISVCAPVWEEIIFRGFLLPSMTRYLPLLGAIFVSALAFALAHFSMQRVLPLTFLGLVMGFVFVRSKNLLASIVLHSLWNGFAFLELL